MIGKMGTGTLLHAKINYHLLMVERTEIEDSIYE